MISTTNITGPVSRNAGGLFESVRRLVQSLGVTGMDVRVCGLADEFCAEDIAAWDPIAVATFKPVGPKQFSYSPGMLDEVTAFAPDIVHTHGIWMYSSVVTSRYARHTGRPYVISPHGMLDPWAVRNSAWKKRLALALYERRHLEGAACLRALCESEARSFRAFGLRNPIAIIPNGIDLPIPSPQGGEGGRRPDEVGFATSAIIPPWQSAVQPGRKVLLFLSRIHPKKGLVNLLRAWASTLTSQPSTANNWVLAIAGWDQAGHEAELKQLATELGIQWADVRDQKPEAGEWRSENLQPSTSNFQPAASLIFLGPQFGDNKAACYRACDAFILPSFSEGLPMVILEAWAYGKPVLMTPECNLPEGFAASAALGISTDVAGIAAGLRNLIEMKDAERVAMGVQGRQLVASRFTWPTIAAQMKSVYDWILGSGPKPDCVTKA